MYIPEGLGYEVRDSLKLKIDLNEPSRRRKKMVKYIKKVMNKNEG